MPTEYNHKRVIDRGYGLIDFFYNRCNGYLNLKRKTRGNNKEKTVLFGKSHLPHAEVLSQRERIKVSALQSLVQ